MDTWQIFVAIAMVLCIILIYIQFTSKNTTPEDFTATKSARRRARLRALKHDVARIKMQRAINEYNQLTGYQNDTETDVVARNLVSDIREDPQNTAAIYMLSRLNRYNRNNAEAANALLDATLRNIIDTDTVMQDYTMNAIVERVENPVVVQQIVAPKAKKRKQMVAAGADRATQDAAYFQDIGVYSDSQNVHDRSVSDINKRRYKRLRKLVTGGDRNTTPHTASSEDVVAWVRERANTNKLQAAVRAVERITWDNSPVMSIDANESDVLRLAFTRIQSETDPERRDNLEKIFMQQLSDCEEGNNMVCSTGRVSRILDVFTAMDADPVLSEAPKTVGIVRKEVFEKAHNFIQTNLDPEIRPLYEAADTTPEDTKRLEAEMTRLKNKFTEDIQKEYETSGLESGVLSGVVAEAIEGF